MSRVAKSPITLPSGVSIAVDAKNQMTVKGSKGSLIHYLNPLVTVKVDGNVAKIEITQESQQAWAVAGTTRAVLNNMVIGVSKGFERKLSLVGVGYKAQAKGKVLNLALGFSHPIDYELPEGITAETPTQTEILIKGIDKQLVGQVAANVRGFRPPEPYKGKGVRYSDENVLRKEAKKK